MMDLLGNTSAIRKIVAASGEDGVWRGELRYNFADADSVISKLVESGEFVVVKAMPKGGPERKWMVFLKGNEPGRQ